LKGAARVATCGKGGRGLKGAAKVATCADTCGKGGSGLKGAACSAACAATWGKGGRGLKGAAKVATCADTWGKGGRGLKGADRAKACPIAKVAKTALKTMLRKFNELECMRIRSLGVEKLCTVRVPQTGHLGYHKSNHLCNYLGGRGSAGPILLLLGEDRGYPGAREDARPEGQRAVGRPGSRFSGPLPPRRARHFRAFSEYTWTFSEQ